MLLPLRQNAATKPQRSGRTQSNTPTLCPCGRAPRQNAALRRLQPHSGAAAFQGVIGESKEGLGGTRNPPGPPWPPEAATRLLTQPYAAQERAAKTSKQEKNAKPRKTPCNTPASIEAQDGLHALPRSPGAACARQTGPYATKSRTCRPAAPAGSKPVMTMRTHA